MTRSAINCKSCHFRIGLRQYRLICAQCGKSYHKTCHPLVKKLQAGYKVGNVKPDWICPTCVEGEDHNRQPDADNEASSTSDEAEPFGSCERVPTPMFAKGQKFGHININSIHGKIDEFRQFLMSHKFWRMT